MAAAKSYRDMADPPPVPLAGSLVRAQMESKESQMFAPTSTKQTKAAFGAQVVLTVLVSVALFMVFIMIFFFALTRNVEKKVVSTSVERVVSDLSKQLIKLESAAGGQMSLQPLQSIIQNLQAPNAQAADAEVKERNQKLVRQASYVALGVTLVVICAAVGVFIGMKKHKDMPDPTHVLKSAAYGFAAVAFCEILFLFMVAARYQPLDESATKQAIVQALVTGIEKLP